MTPHSRPRQLAQRHELRTSTDQATDGVWAVVRAGLGGGLGAAPLVGASNENSKPLRTFKFFAAPSIYTC